MPWFAGFLFLLVAALPAATGSISVMTQKVDRLSTLDQKLKARAEATASALNSAISLNAALLALYLECPVAMYSGTVPVVQAQGESIRNLQDGLVMAAQAATESVALECEVKLNKPSRSVAAVCNLPGVLRYLNKEVFSFSTYSGVNPAGVLAESEPDQMVKWKYFDERVREL